MWRVERFSENKIDTEHILSFLNLCFDHWGDKDYWKWKYAQKSLLNLSSNVWLISDGYKIIGHYGHIPLRIKVGNDVIYGSQAVDSATHPEYRRKGIFELLDKTSIKDASSEGTKVFYGLGVTPSATKGHIAKGGWKFWCNVIGLKRILDFKRLENKYVKNKFLGRIISSGFNSIFIPKYLKKFSDIKIREIEKFDSNIMPLVSRASEKFDFIVERTPEYLNWRLSNPYRNYHKFVALHNNRICGYIIVYCNSEKNRFEIEDYLYNGGSNIFDALLNAISIKALESGCDSMTVSITQYHPYKLRFYKNLFIPVGQSGSYICHFENAEAKHQSIFENPKSRVHLTRLDKNE
jgi:GNAT superfamily N-acetyltransferase